MIPKWEFRKRRKWGEIEEMRAKRKGDLQMNAECLDQSWFDIC